MLVCFYVSIVTFMVTQDTASIRIIKMVNQILPWKMWSFFIYTVYMLTYSSSTKGGSIIGMFYKIHSGY